MTDPTGPVIDTSNDPWAHLVIDVLIIWTKDYIVYIDTKKTLQWETTPDYDNLVLKDTKFDLTKRNSILSDAAVLEASAREDLGAKARDELLCLIGNAIACSIDLDYVGAQKALVSARQYLRERSEEVSRFWYLSSSFGMALVFLVFGCVIWLWRSYFEKLLEPTVMWVVLAAVSGATGALLSVILRSGKLNFDSSAGKWLHYLEGASRIWAGALSGVIASLAIKAGIILGTLATTKTNAVMILASIAAGASERFATSIISKIGSENGKGPDSDSKRKSG